MQNARHPKTHRELCELACRFLRNNGFCLFTGGLCAHVLPVREVATGPRTFWFRPVSIFGLLPITVFINSSHVLTLLTSLALLPHDACSKVKPLTGHYPG